MNGTNDDPDPDSDRSGPTDIDERYCARQEQDGSVVIYDDRADDAWIRSDHAVAVAGADER
jgi:hypothetical protein